MSKDLRQYLEAVKQAGTDFYVEVKRPLRPKFEVSVLQQKLAAADRYPVIYCPRIEGSRLPLVTNIFGAYERWALALGIDDARLEREGKAAILKEFRRREHAALPVREVTPGDAPVKEVVLRGKDVDLDLLPITHHAQLDSGKYITIGSMICKDPETGVPNVGVYRHEQKGKDLLGCMTSPGNHGDYIARRYAELGRPMEVVIFVGHHPLVLLGSCAAGHINMSELEVMGGMLGEPLEVVPAETVDLPVPARAEIAIEGVIDAVHPVTDGPFAEYLNYYGEGHKRCYLMRVTAITMRQDAIYHDLDPAHREHILCPVLGFESNAYDYVSRVVPTVKTVHLYPTELGTKIACVSIKKRVPGEARLAGLAAISNAQVKASIVVDEDVDVFNGQEVLWAIGTRVTADRDIQVIPDMLGAHLDPTAYSETRPKRGPMVTKVVIDATTPVEQPFETRITPPRDIWRDMDIAEYLGE
ncbi:MAG: UbiD family decarboxylase [Chloroflexi bacterium]|nr:UbiD family decarboxylase [Chloroflexota bacterium]